MAEEGTYATSVQLDVMRSISATFDEASNVLILDGPSGALSFGTPLEVLESKAKLLAKDVGIATFTMGTEHGDRFQLEQENTQLRSENYALRESVRAIEERLAILEAAIPSERTIVLREVTRDQAREEIRSLFSTGRTLYYSDIAQELGLDLETVVDLCRELQSDGEIDVDVGVS